MRSDAKTQARAAALAACFGVLATGCGRDVDVAQGAPAPEPRPLPPAATMNPADVVDVTASFDCEGIRVDVVRDTVARVNLAPDNIVKIERIRNSAPPTFQDVGLTFTITGAGANLDDENDRSLSCEAVGPPGAAARPASG